jgi:hypothetical protein
MESSTAYHRYVKNLECLGFYGSEESVEQDRVEDGTEDILGQMSI